MALFEDAVLYARRGTAGLLDVLLPPQCLRCRIPVDRQGLLCGSCWREINFIVPPYCAICGLPFAHDEGQDAICGACARKAPSFDHARSATVYDDASRPLLLGFKYGDRTEAASALAQWLYRAGDGLVDAADLIVPVPLYRWRLWRRRYNQSALLAAALGKISGRDVISDLVVRHRSTKSQRGLTPGERRRNVRGAFAVPVHHRSRVQRACIVLVDDVLTTGATAEAVAAALRQAGARQVDVLTLARVVRVDG